MRRADVLSFKDRNYDLEKILSKGLKNIDKDNSEQAQILASRRKEPLINLKSKEKKETLRTEPLTPELIGLEKDPAKSKRRRL